MERDVASAMKSEFDEQLEERLDRLCKPPGSLGDLELLARRLCATQRTLSPATKPRRTVIFAADHGVTCEGVSAWPSEVTASVVQMMQRSRTASGVFARALQSEYEVVDVGLIRPIDKGPMNGRLIHASQRAGTGNLLHQAAMSTTDFDHSWDVGRSRAASANQDGCRLVIGGEMGVGNTTSASCLIGLFTEIDSDRIVGRGAGIDDTGLARKREVVRSAIKRVKTLGKVDAKRMGCEVGGLEIVALAGFYAHAAELGLTIVLDGFIATAAAILAEAIRPTTCDQMIAGHRSSEPGHVMALSHLGLTPLLDLNLRLGEASGALVALPLIDLAAAMINQMATLDDLIFP